MDIKPILSSLRRSPTGAQHARHRHHRLGDPSLHRSFPLVLQAHRSGPGWAGRSRSVRRPWTAAAQAGTPVVTAVALRDKADSSTS